MVCNRVQEFVNRPEFSNLLKLDLLPSSGEGKEALHSVGSLRKELTCPAVEVTLHAVSCPSFGCG
jgi:hypothetical protein